MNTAQSDFRVQTGIFFSFQVSLDEMGLSHTLLTPLIEKYFQSITKLLFSNWGGGCIDSFKSFVVQYDKDRHPSLSKHFDNAEVSMSICLSSEFEGGELQLDHVLGQEDDVDLEPVVVEQKVSFYFYIIIANRQHQFIENAIHTIQNLF